jgi:hypothetical protein
MCLAKQAYNKFGARPVSEANLLVTRKWLQKLVEESFKDLRTCDKNIAIDRALFLSFVPTLSFNQMKTLIDTGVFQDRINNVQPSLFGRVFSLKKGTPAA